MPRKAKNNAAADVQLNVLLNVLLTYAETAGQKLSVTHVVASTGLAQSTVFAKIAAAKKNGPKPLSGVDLNRALPALINYANLSGIKLSAKHVSTACNIALSTAHAKIAQAKSDSRMEVPDSGTAGTSNADATFTNPKTRGAWKRKSDAAVKADADEMSTKPEVKVDRKRKSDAASAQKIKAEESPGPPSTEHNFAVVIPAGEFGNEQDSTHLGPVGIKRKTVNEGYQTQTIKDTAPIRKVKEALAVVIDAYGSQKSHAVSKKNGTSRANIKNHAGPSTVRLADTIANESTLGTKSTDPPKAKRGRPSKKTKTENSSASTEPNEFATTNTIKTDDVPTPIGSSLSSTKLASDKPGNNPATPMRKSGVRAINHEHAAIIDSERSLSLDGATDTTATNEKALNAHPKNQGGASRMDAKAPVEIDSFDSADKPREIMLNAMTAEQESSMSGTFKRDDRLAQKEKMLGVDTLALDARTRPLDDDDNIAKLMEEFIDMEKGEAARGVVAEAWPFN